MSMPEAIKKAAEVAKQIVAGVTPEQYADPTPCADFDVHALGNHMTKFLPWGANAVRRQPEIEIDVPDIADMDWPNTFAAMVDDLVAAWHEEGAFEGEVKFGRTPMPAQNAAGISLMELTVHAWDLARATGQEYQLDSATEQMAAAVTAAAGPPGRDLGFFGPEVEAPADASDWEKALAMSGRDPGWESPAA
jgi:uncharacterized protein (TIGR03086 family)